MNCGVKFCGGCNPRYDRGKALIHIKEVLADSGLQFENVKEDVAYDLLLIIGGCSACCASYEQYQFKHGPIRIWEECQIEEAIEQLRAYT